MRVLNHARFDMANVIECSCWEFHCGKAGDEAEQELLSDLLFGGDAELHLQLVINTSGCRLIPIVLCMAIVLLNSPLISICERISLARVTELSSWLGLVTPNLSCKRGRVVGAAKPWKQYANSDQDSWKCPYVAPTNKVFLIPFISDKC